MIKNALLIFMLVCAGVLPAQKITIDPDLIVSLTDFETEVENLPYSQKADLIIDSIYGGGANVSVLKRGFAIWGLTIDFRNDSIIPKYHHWNDGGGIVTVLDFDSYELTLNASGYKLGDRVMGRFRGSATEQLPNGKAHVHKFAGKFMNIMTNDLKNSSNFINYESVKKSWEAKKRYRDTGIYALMEGQKGLELNLEPYELGPDKEEYFPEKEVVSLAGFIQASSAPGSSKGTTNIILKLDAATQAQTVNQLGQYAKLALLHKNQLISAGKVSVSAGKITFMVYTTNKTEVGKIVSEINSAISKARAQRKKQ
jgi:hypothetical protein